MKCFACLLGFILMTASSALADPPPENYSLDRTSHDFGTIKPNRAETAVFQITNQSDTPLVILDARVSCNCVKVDWPRQPVLPGKTADITVVYKDKSPGAFYKTIDITTNAVPRRTQIRLKGTVEK
ncbi:MAG: DUF1573 domain-containing protein [Rikenellaceae bacterium]|nr:DUF1573 domain-containing protein [Rikenellaceae bacterium]